MNPTANTVSRITEIFQKNTSGIIVLPNNPTQDAIAAATALYLFLMKEQKTVSLACSSSVQSELPATDKIAQNLSVNGDNLVVSFPYQDGTIDKIDYHIKGNFFNLVISPRQGFPKLNPKDVTYSYSGGTFDFIVVIDAPNLNSLGTLYTENQSQFQGKNLINIDRHLTNAFYGSINYVNKSSSSISEMVFKIISSFQKPLDKDAATNLYAGITAATNNFTSYSVNAETFETVAALLKAGAVKKMLGKTVQQRPVPPPYPSSPSAFERPLQSNIKTVEQTPGQVVREGSSSAQEWLKPKIFSDGMG